MIFNLIEVPFKMEVHKIYVVNVILLLSFFKISEAYSMAFISHLQTGDHQLAVNACAIVNCGQGTCRADNSALFGFDCDCYPGWKKFQYGPFQLPPCIIPNCTLDFGCGEGSPSPPSPPPPSFNLSDPCSFTWCGDGTCKTNGTGYECDCHAGSDNLLNKTALPCFKDCTLGADCHGVGLGTPPAPNTNSSPPDQSSPSHGLREHRTASPIIDSTLLMLAAIFLPWL